MNKLLRRLSKTSVLMCIFAALATSACGGEPEEDLSESEPEVESLARAGGGVNCASRQDTGYRNGAPYGVEVITVDGKPVTKETANHYVAMQRAAASAGIGLVINDGFRTMQEQTYFWNCFQTKSCNNGNEAARPGYGNHQNGTALDIQVNDRISAWLRANARRFGFEARLPHEPWHWERNFPGESVQVCPGSDVGADGCTNVERTNAAMFGCQCVNHQPSGGYCDGSGCTAQEERNCASVGTQCVDHKCSGGFTEGTGCTAREEKNCASVGTQCVDHKCSGGFTEGSGCTALEEKNCAAFGTQCVDHKCSGGFGEGNGCTARQNADCEAKGQSCRDHVCVAK
jgi:hypothetical protein